MEQPIRPERLYRNGRPEHPEFEPEELLYRRCTDPDHINPDGSVLAEAFRFPDLSIVRGGGTASFPHAFEATDAQWVSATDLGAAGREHLPECGVAAFRVKHIPSEVRRDDAAAAPYTTRVAHVPYDDHYPHAEVHVWKGDDRIVGGESKIKASARRLLREQIAQSAWAEIMPTR